MFFSEISCKIAKATKNFERGKVMENITFYKMTKSEFRASVITKVLAILASCYGMFITIEGLFAFSYFTNQSNIFIDIALLISLVGDILVYTGKKQEKANWIYILKFLATISITLTFLVYMFLLAPTAEGGILHAYFKNYAGSFFVHFVGPVIAIADFIIFDYRYKSKNIHILYGITPPLCYVVYVIIMGQCFDMRWGKEKDMIAPYNFMNYGAKTGWFGFDLNEMSSKTLGIGVFYMIIALVIIFLILGAIYLKIKNLRARKKMTLLEK